MLGESAQNMASLAAAPPIVEVGSLEDGSIEESGSSIDEGSLSLEGSQEGSVSGAAGVAYDPAGAGGGGLYEGLARRQQHLEGDAAAGLAQETAAAARAAAGAHLRRARLDQDAHLHSDVGLRRAHAQHR